MRAQTGRPFVPLSVHNLGRGSGRLIQKALSEGKIKGLKNQLDFEPVTHLQFMDDNLLMGIPITREAKSIKNLLDTYKEASRYSDKSIKIPNFFF
jgi:hypothetical protein